ncbi:MAG: ERF family protein [Candidatus Paceibacterota bacterium]|jgi:hypothetical protein
MKKTETLPVKQEAKNEIAISEQRSVENLISQAIEKGTPVETMERLLAMRRELKAEFAKEAYDREMAEFQSECPTIKKTKSVKTDGGVVAYKYAPIESIVEQVKPLLKRYGFSYSTQTINQIDKVKAICIVKHMAGHSENYEMEVPLGNKTKIMSPTQVVAAATTFAKRYAFCNAFGILTGDEDTDARPQSDEQVKYSEEPRKDPGFEILRKAIGKTTGKELKSLVEKMKTSKKYTKQQRNEFATLCIARIAELKNEKINKDFEPATKALEGELVEVETSKKKA